MKKLLLSALSAFVCLSSVANDVHTLHVLVTGDVHGSWFPRSYVDTTSLRTNLMSVKAEVDRIRDSVGRENVLLIDAGDCLQGNNASYYINFEASGKSHLFPLLASYMGYDAIVVGNHDIEAGHPVYDRVGRELAFHHIPFLGGNAIKPDGEPYFPEYAVFNRAGMKILVLGYTNANIKSWVSEAQWKGMEFQPIKERIRNSMERIVKKEKPQVVIVATHTGTGEGDGKQLENEGLDIFNSMEGVDLLICAHDHRPFVKNSGESSLLNTGSKVGNLGHAVLTVETSGKKVVSREVAARVTRLDKKKYDRRMEERFRKEFKDVRNFTLRPVGRLEMELRTSDAYVGMCDYVNLLHSVQLGVPEAKLSLAAPLTFNGKVKAGQVLFNDMFTIYPFENQLFVVNLTGEEILKVLEYTYDNWIENSGEHILKISNKPDSRTGSPRWSFVGRPYNFDSMAGLVYEVDVTKPYGSRISVKTLADGTAFDLKAMYPVAMTSYRANGGGGSLPKGAGITVENLQGRIVARYPEIRELICQYFLKHGVVTNELVNDRSVLGHWEFVPVEVAEPGLKKDMELLFGD